jgi:two-component system response regulator HydG
MQTLDDMERQMIERAMASCGGNMSAVAARLGISRQTLYNKIKRYGL